MKKIINCSLDNLNSELIEYTEKIYNNKEIFYELYTHIYSMFLELQFSKEENNYIQNFISLNREILKESDQNYSATKYTALLFSSWIILSSGSDMIEKTYISNNKFYIDRYAFIYKIISFLEKYLVVFNKNFKKNIKIEKKIFFLIISYLVDNKFFDIKILSVKNKKTFKNVYFIVLKDFKIKNYTINFNIFKVKPKWWYSGGYSDGYYLGGYHYSTLFKVFEKNKSNNNIFLLKNKNIINILCSVAFQIDFKMYNIIYSLICEDLKIENTENSLENYIYDTIEFNNLSLMIYRKKDYFKLFKFLKKKNQKVYSQLLIYYLFIQIKKKLVNIQEFYMTISFDFRGRVYYNSCISPLGPKLFRYFYYYGYYTEKELKLIELKILSDKQMKILKENIFLEEFKNINLNDNKKAAYFYWLIFEIGKIFKNELSEKKNGIFEDLDLLVFANIKILEIKKKKTMLTLQQKIEYNYLLLALEDLNKDLYKKIILYKDVTASGIQLLTVILGANNKDFLKYCNLDSNYFWYDTYHLIINIFIQQNIDFLKNYIGEDYILYLKRSYLKKSIMTYIYGAKYITLLDYYIDSIDNSLNKEKANKIFKIFYYFLVNFFESKNFFKLPFSTLLENAKKIFLNDENIIIQTADKSLIYLNYNKLCYRRLDRIFYKKRNTIKYGISSELFDLKKTYRSLTPNIIQSLDALFLRFIVEELGYGIITIHDCFGIDILNTDLLLQKANTAINKVGYEYYNNSIVKRDKIKIMQYYSIFLLI